VVVIGEGQVLDAVVHGIAQVVAHVRPDPFGQVALAQVQDGRARADANQDQRRADQECGCPGFQALVNHALDDLRHHQRETGHAQQDEHVEHELPEIWFEIGA